MKLIFGLGNPGRKYSGTRHNLGFMLVDKLAQSFGFAFSNRLFKSSLAEGTVKFSLSNGEEKIISEKIILVKPQTYMNLSGESVFSLYKWYKIELKDILVVCDDFNLPVGTLRFRAKGSDGGHNGLKSVINLLGNQDFPRLRIGIGNFTHDNPADYVLSKLSAEEKEKIEVIIDKAIEGIDCYIKSDIETAMSLYNKNFIP